MDSDEALMVIRAAWGAWALKQIDEVEFAARVSDALEAANFPVIRKVESIEPDNDGG